MKRTYVLGLISAMTVFGYGCHKKTPEQKAAEIRQEADHDVAEARKDASEDIKDEQKDVREEQKDVQHEVNEENKEVAEIRRDEANDLAKVEAGAAGDRAEDQRDAFAKDYQARLDKFEDRMDKVTDKVDDKGKATEQATATVVADAKAKHDAAETQLKALKDADAATWTRLQGGVETAFNDLDAAVAKAEASVAAH